MDVVTRRLGFVYVLVSQVYHSGSYFPNIQGSASGALALSSSPENKYNQNFEYYKYIRGV